MAARLTRAIVLWCPDWPIIAATRAEECPVSTDVPLALVDHGLIFACSRAARAEGVQRGLTVREAQYRCTTLTLLPYDPVQDARAFEPVISTVEEITPGVQLLRPGTCAIRARGPSRYYGGEAEAAAALINRLAALGIPDVRVGVADGPFAAEQAARATRPARAARATQDMTLSDAVRIVPPGASPGFLAPLPITLVVDARLSTLLHRLGVHSLGDFAALPALDVRRRFGPEGAQAHEKASGLDSRSVVARVPPKLRDLLIEFEPALDRVDQVTFAIRASAEQFIDGLTQARLVCTAVQIEVRTESGEISLRSWLHPRWFSAADVVDRVRWQLQGGGTIDAGLRSGIVKVHIMPERVDSTSHHEQGLWGSGPDERIHHGLTRVQSMLGHQGVLTAVIGGGRMLADRQILVPWGDEVPGSASALPRAQAQPWPGSMPGLPPTTVFQDRPPIALITAAGEPVDVDERGLLTELPDRFSPTNRPGDLRPVEAWAGPWPVVERWWDAACGRTVHRFQVVDADGDAWLLALEDHEWKAEARYD
ncbi:DNA polymerase Y family protein [Glaciibacter psychrotolerans]|uniref:Protein ImuB n=1 Tax=Glaciibacter psychrotolerans TaxID=670054 RepID=A0A7Z0J5F1_9MICO|nr:DNA polymerase Y family protein [Leifsonia psychrotolerans]NYJ19325.1 protein ImuB [Leifsonia psychrotolerans]